MSTSNTLGCHSNLSCEGNITVISSHLKSLVELHFLCRGDMEEEVITTPGGSLELRVTGEGAGDMELLVSVCRLELEVYSPD